MGEEACSLTEELCLLLKHVTVMYLASDSPRDPISWTEKMPKKAGPYVETGSEGLHHF